MHCGLDVLLATCRGALEGICLFTLRARHDLAGIRRNVDTRDRLVVPRQLILQLKASARPRVQVDVVLAGDGERLAVGGEGVVRDGVVEEVVHFWGGHSEKR